jgi:hypothetical protein
MMTKQPQSGHSSRNRHLCAQPGHRGVITTLVETSIQNFASVDRVRSSTERSFFNIAVACTILGGLVACGSSSSNPTPELNSRATATHSLGADVQEVGVDSDAGASVRKGVAERDWSDRHNRSAPDQLAPSTAKTNEDNSSPTPNIPHSIASELASPNPRTRYDALNYWETKGTQASIDPVFEAMEDEDPSVRAKATAIIEQRWEAEQELERG